MSTGTEEEITVEVLFKKKEYDQVITHFKQWNAWQRRYFFCNYTGSLPINILEILLTDFEPLYHSGYNEQLGNSVSLSKESLSAGRSLAAFKSATSTGIKRSRVPQDRLHHTHETEDVFDSKTITDYILQPNPINVQAYAQSLDANTMKNIFLEELEHLSQIYRTWDTYEYIHLIHILLPHCCRDTLMFLSSCINLRIFKYDMVIRLPDNVVQIVLSHLHPRDLATTAKVCKSWKVLSYKCPSWKLHATQLNYTGIDFEQLAVKSEDTIWRRIYIELFELAKQNIVKPRSRFGSIIQSFQTVPQVVDQAGKLARRQSLMPDLLNFQFAVMSAEKINKSNAQNKRLNKATKKEYVPKIKINKDMRSTPTSTTPRTPLVSARITSQVKSPRNTITAPRPKRNALPLGSNEEQVPTAVPIDKMERVVSVHESYCEEDTLSHEESMSELRRHSLKHVQFVKSVTGYSDYMSALATTYPLHHVHELLGHKHPVTTFQCDLLRILSGCKNGVLRLWDAKTGRPVKKTKAHNGAINSLQFDGYKIVTGGWDRTVKVFNITTLECEAELLGHTESVTTVFYDRRHIISGSLDKSLRVYEPHPPYTCTHVCTGHEAGVTHGDMDQDCILSGSLDHAIRLWCAKYYNLVRVIYCGGEVLHFTFDQNLILASTANKRILFIDKAKQFPSHSIATEETIAYIWLYGTRFITGGTSGVVQEWDLPSGALLRRLHGHLGPISCIQASKSRILSSSWDKSIKVWHLTELKSRDTDTVL